MDRLAGVKGKKIRNAMQGQSLWHHLSGEAVIEFVTPANWGVWNVGGGKRETWKVLQSFKGRMKGAYRHTHTHTGPGVVMLWLCLILAKQRGWVWSPWTWSRESQFCGRQEEGGLQGEPSFLCAPSYHIHLQITGSLEKPSLLPVSVTFLWQMLRL